MRRYIFMKYEMEMLEKLMFYDSEGIISSFPMFIFKMKDDIDTHALQCAVVTAIKCHPLYGCKIMEDQKGPYLETNPEPPIIVELNPDTELFYGNQTNNHYPWLIGLRGKEILFTQFHGLADAMGAMNFMKTVFYYYFQECGIACANDSVLTFEKMNPETLIRKTECTMRKIGQTKASSMIPKTELKETVIPDAMFETDSEKVSPYTISIDLKSVKEKAKASGVSQFAELAPYFCEAFASVLPGDENVIKYTVICDTRRFTNSITSHNCVISADIYYEQKKCSSLSKDAVRSYFREQLDCALTANEIASSYHGIVELEKQIGENKQYIAGAAAAMVADFGLNTPYATVTYSHLTRLGFPEDMLAQFEDIFCTSSSTSFPKSAALPLVEVITVGDHINFTMLDQLKGHPIMNAFMKKLEEDGIPCSRKEADKYRGVRWKHQD